MSGRISLAAVTDEFSPDLETALRAMAGLGMAGAELRTVWGRNVIDLTDDEVDRARALATHYGQRVLSIASPVLKCTLPGGPPVDARFQQDMFSAKYTAADQPRLTRRALEIAQRAGASIVRVFSYWRTVDPDACFDRVVASLRELADQALAAGVVIGLENEHACNIATGEESGRLLRALAHPALQLIWDPANAMVLGERAFPDGYSHVPASRIAHVHAKDGRVDGATPVWTAIGDGAVDWSGQIAALARDGYRGAISLETHWKGPNGDKFEASEICGRVLAGLVERHAPKRSP